jgi:hypothetical protein
MATNDNDLNQIEEDSIKDILSSMGIDQYDTNVVAALSEYARSKIINL